MPSGFALGVLLFLALGQMPHFAFAADSDDVPTLLTKAQRAGTPEEAKTLLSAMMRRSISEGEETSSVYEGLKLAAQIIEKNNDAVHDQTWATVVAGLGHQLATSTSPAQQEIILQSLQIEAASVPSASTTDLVSNRARINYNLRLDRLHALMESVANAKNKNSLPLLRSVLQKYPSSIPGKFADDAIKEIGDPEDLRVRIEQLKADPSLRMDLSSFGPLIIQPIVRELENPQLSQDQKNILLNALDQARSHDAVPEYAKLLTHPDPEIQRVAAHRLSAYATRDDAHLLRQMFSSKSSEVRFAGFNAMNYHAWDQQFVPDLENALKNDPDDQIRGLAAFILGHYRVKSAEKFLEEAQHDTERNVRISAEAALKTIRGQDRY